uniref:Uncharacterized protein n=1 Tax=Zea mays TaxID=4577 RepID=C4J539_MAIZE|nr:unknown [Zea mays]
MEHQIQQRTPSLIQRNQASHADSLQRSSTCTQSSSRHTSMTGAGSSLPCQSKVCNQSLKPQQRKWLKEELNRLVPQYQVQPCQILQAALLFQLCCEHPVIESKLGSYFSQHPMHAWQCHYTKSYLI